MPVNVELLKQVRKKIAEEPRRLVMDLWGSKVVNLNVLNKPINPPPCGTVACLAGWTVLTARPELADKINDRSLNSYLHFEENADIESVAANLLGIPRRECPFWKTEWNADDVLAWIDRQIDAASK